MRLAQRYLWQVWDTYDGRSCGLELLPAVLSEACVQVLPVAGAGISMTLDELRVPLGSSGESAARVERLQTTLGEGPCLGAMAADEPRLFCEAAIAQNWPLFHRQVVAETPYRSVASVPIHSAESTCVGALDLYFVESEQVPLHDIAEVSSAIGTQISCLLFDAPGKAFQAGITMPIWLSGESVTDRMNVWVAVAILIEHADLTNPDALSALRAYAFAHDLSLDQVADDLTAERLPPAALLG